MSWLHFLAGSSPQPPALEARSSNSAYEGCYSLDTSTALSIYNLDQSDPPTCASTCGDEYSYTAIQAQFCFCFPSPPQLFTTYNDTDCSINCDIPYQDESCGGLMPGTLTNVYSYYAVSNVAVPYDGDGQWSSTANSPTASEQIGTATELTTASTASSITPEPTTVGTSGPARPVEPPSPASDTSGNKPEPTSPQEPLDTGTPNPVATEATAADSGPSGELTSSPSPTSAADIEPQASAAPDPTPASGADSVTTAASSPDSTPTYTITLWTTLTVYTTIFPGGPLQSTVFSSPTGTSCFTAERYTSSCSDVTVTITRDEDGSETTSVLPGSTLVMAYNPYESEVKEVWETEGTSLVLAAVVVARTAGVGELGRK